MSAPALSRAPRWVRVCALEEIPEAGGRLCTVGAIEVGVFRTRHGAILALVNRCPHKGGPLSEGIVTDHVVVCPLHGWKIDLVTGEAVAPDAGCVTRFPVDVRGEDVYLDASTLPRERSPLCDVTGVHPDSGRPRLGRRRALPADFTRMDFDRALPVLSVEPPSPDTETTLALAITREERPLAALSIEELRARHPVVRAPAHLTCLMFGFCRAVTWTGVRLADVLDGFPSLPFVSFYSWESDATAERRRFFETLPIAYARDPRTLLAFQLDDQPLPKEHGGPLRLVVPFLQGYKSVKWLSAIKLCGEDELGYKRLHGFIDFPELEPPPNWRRSRSRESPK